VPTREIKFALIPLKKYDNYQSINEYVWLEKYVVEFRVVLKGRHIINRCTIDEDFQKRLES